jgi:D-alanyl-D-alanine carboxypeptidase
LDWLLRGWGFMILFADLLMHRTHRPQPTAYRPRRRAALALTVLFASAVLAHPADARKRRARSFYAPPQAAMVVDGYTGKIIHASNPDEPRYPASITKVMTLYLLFEKLKAGRLKMDSQLRVSAEAASQAPSKLGLQPGSTIAVKDAIYALVTKSANDCAVVVAENLAGSEEEFARLMTAKAQALGMNNTTFRNASGLPNSEQRTTARDLITLARRILADFPEYAGVFRTRSFTYGGESHRNHNGLLFTYQGMEGLKTGFTQASGFNLLTSARRENRHLLAVVLGGRSAGERNARMSSLLNASWARAADGTKVKIAPLPEVEIASAVLDMPERNPAFHPSSSERAMTVAMAAMLDLDRLRTETAVASRRGTATVAAADIAAPPAAAVAAAAASAAEDEEAAAVEGASAADESAGEAPAEEGDTTASAAPPDLLGPYHIQVGSYASAAGAKTWLQAVAGKAKGVLNGHGELTLEGQVNGRARYRARFGKFSEIEAKSACGKLKALSIDCMVVRAE